MCWRYPFLWGVISSLRASRVATRAEQGPALVRFGLALVSRPSATPHHSGSSQLSENFPKKVVRTIQIPGLWGVEGTMLHFALSLLTLLSPQVAQSSEFPGQCETLTTSKNGPHLKRVRRADTSKEEVVAVIRAVAAEMGADPQLLLAIAAHESTWAPGALHVLPGDRGAGLAAWQSASYSESREKRYQSILSVGPQHPRFYPAKLGMWRMSLYKDNAYWDHKTMIGDQEVGVWTYGYGLYGMAPVLYVRLWDTTSPPWVLCDPAVATATLVWALRGQKAACAARGESGTVEQVIARYATGRCGNKVKKSWKSAVAKTKKVALGNKWKQETADRAALLQAISRRLELAQG